MSGAKWSDRSLTAAQLVDACRVPPTMPNGEFGPWVIATETAAMFARDFLGFPSGDEPLPYTVLGRMTLATMHQPYGDIVMEDSPREIRRHLPLLLAARGRVLVSGLGLGCVVRGLLAKPEVEHITVMELDPHILAAVGPEFEGNPRVWLREGDALTLQWSPHAWWDFAWHDVWTEEGSLDVLHAELLARYEKHCGRQGAWQFNRVAKRIWPDPLLNSRRRRPPRAEAAPC